MNPELIVWFGILVYFRRREIAAIADKWSTSTKKGKIYMAADIISGLSVFLLAILIFKLKITFLLIPGLVLFVVNCTVVDLMLVDQYGNLSTMQSRHKILFVIDTLASVAVAVFLYFTLSNILGLKPIQQLRIFVGLIVAIKMVAYWLFRVQIKKPLKVTH